MSNRKLEVIALLSKDRRFAELTASFNGLNLKQRFPGLSRDDQAEVVRAARRLVQAWQTEDAELGNLPAANADSAGEPAEVPDETAQTQAAAGDEAPSHAKVTRIERPRATAAPDEIAETSTDKAWTNVISGSNTASAWPSAATMALLLFAVLMGGGLILYGDRIATFANRGGPVSTDADGNVSDAGPSTPTSDPPAARASASRPSGNARENRVEAIIARHKDKLTATDETAEATDGATGSQVAAMPESVAALPVEAQPPLVDAAEASGVSDETTSESVSDASEQTVADVEVLEASDAVQPLVTGETTAEGTSATGDGAVLESIVAETTQEAGETVEIVEIAESGETAEAREPVTDAEAIEVVDTVVPIQSPYPDNAVAIGASAEESMDTTSIPPDEAVDVSEIPVISPAVETVELQESSVEYEVITETVPAETETSVVESAPTETLEVAVASPVRPRANAKPYETNADPRLVRRIQTQLKLLGFDPGPIDGLMGRKTYTAIREFQADKGLRVDGRPTDLLLGALISYQP